MTSDQFIFIFGCRSDFVLNNFTGTKDHKHILAQYLVIVDMISSIIIFYIFQRLKYINNYFIETIDS